MLKRLVCLSFATLAFVQAVFIKVVFAQEDVIQKTLDSRKDLMSLYFQGEIVVFKFASSLEKRFLVNSHNNRFADTQGLLLATDKQQKIVLKSEEEKQQKKDFLKHGLSKKQSNILKDDIDFVSSNFTFSEAEKKLFASESIFESDRVFFANNTQYLNNSYIVLAKLSEENQEEANDVSAQLMYFEYEENSMQVSNRRKSVSSKASNVAIMNYIALLSYLDVNFICYNTRLAKQADKVYFFEAKLNRESCNFDHLYDSVDLIVNKENNSTVRYIYYAKGKKPVFSVEVADFNLVNDSVFWGSKYVITDFRRDYKVYINIDSFYPFYNSRQASLKITYKDFKKLSVKSLYWLKLALKIKPKNHRFLIHL